jgi:hypothetical protein
VFGQDGSTEYSQTQSLTTDALTIPNPEDLAATNTIDQIVRPPSSPSCHPSTFFFACFMLWAGMGLP